MKVLLLNGSPHKEGCTYTALKEMEKEFLKEGIETEIFYIGTNAIAPCRACGACNKLKKCVVDDKVNEFIQVMKECDGLVIGSPVHYASASGVIAPFLDRAFYAGSRAGKDTFTHKPGTSIVSARRAGTTATLDQLNKYFAINQMPIISGRYWNMVHGSTPEDVLKDEEGLQNMRFVARNMIYHLKCKEAGAKVGILPPEQEEVIKTNFIK